MTAKDQTSELWEKTLARRLSTAIHLYGCGLLLLLQYWGTCPLSTPLTGARQLIENTLEWSTVSTHGDNYPPLPYLTARPKSAILTTSLLVRSMLRRATSRWMMPRSARYFMPLDTW